MADWQFDLISDYIKVAPKRLRDAERLLEHGELEAGQPGAGHRHLRGALYLAGYAVECALKAYIISRCPGEQRFSDVVERRRQAGEDLDRRDLAHNLRLLLRTAGLADEVEADPLLRESWNWCRRWDPDMRYNPADFTARREAVDRVAHCRAMHEWIESKRKAR